MLTPVGLWQASFFLINSVALARLLRVGSGRCAECHTQTPANVEDSLLLHDEYRKMRHCLLGRAIEDVGTIKLVLMPQASAIG